MSSRKRGRDQNPIPVSNPPASSQAMASATSTVLADPPSDSHNPSNNANAIGTFNSRRRTTGNNGSTSSVTTAATASTTTAAGGGGSVPSPPSSSSSLSLELSQSQSNNAKTGIKDRTGETNQQLEEKEEDDGGDEDGEDGTAGDEKTTTEAKSHKKKKKKIRRN